MPCDLDLSCGFGLAGAVEVDLGLIVFCLCFELELEPAIAFFGGRSILDGMVSAGRWCARCRCSMWYAGVIEDGSTHDLCYDRFQHFSLLKYVLNASLYP